MSLFWTRSRSSENLLIGSKNFLLSYYESKEDIDFVYSNQRKRNFVSYIYNCLLLKDFHKICSIKWLHFMQNCIDLVKIFWSRRQLRNHFKYYPMRYISRDWCKKIDMNFVYSNQSNPLTLNQKTIIAKEFWIQSK